MQKLNVIGLEISQGIGKETGKPYAIGKLHTILEISNGAFSSREGNVAKGAMGHSYQVEVPILEKVKHLQPPFVAEAEMGEVMRFGKPVMEITSLRPLERSQANTTSGKAVTA